MHEMSLAESVLQVIEDSARANNFTRVKTVWLEIGALAGVEVEAMRFCFDAVVKDSVADGARLEIIESPG
ncbi:hydrogenase maturation nickel metallochaperone HypA, partial [Noviherbaspirillum denitrificans]|uniref:hydrogenase maturation nickel metallochaperone HypA/HybF n=1 Tax=Noviherbaspirillum denitrificans TaxID=1968433 RepID=UPI0011321E23